MLYGWDEKTVLSVMKITVLQTRELMNNNGSWGREKEITSQDIETD